MIAIRFSSGQPKCFYIADLSVSLKSRIKSKYSYTVNVYSIRETDTQSAFNFTE